MLDITAMWIMVLDKVYDACLMTNKMMCDVLKMYALILDVKTMEHLFSLESDV